MKFMVRAWLAVTLAVVVSTAARGNDELIGKQIVERLQQQRQSAQIEGFNVGVKVENGTVTMTGNVAQQEHAAAALDIARRVPGVKLVVNDLAVQQPAARIAPTAPQITPTAYQANVAAPAAIQPAQPMVSGAIAGFAGPQAGPQAAPMPAQMRQGPAARAPRSNSGPQPVAFARSQMGKAQRASFDLAPEYSEGPSYGTEGYSSEGYSTEGYSSGGGGPVPMSAGAAGAGMGHGSYDNPQMPGYAWPSYAAYPNYAAVSYPHQYSPTAWPYIGPFYPYPQVPLGWRKVTMEWDDGWWFLDFKCK